MNAVEIEEAISALAECPFDAEEFPFAFLQAFGNKETTLKRLRKGESNKSDFAGRWGGVLQTSNIHIAVAAPGEVTRTLAALKASPATNRAKAKFVLATDGEAFEAEDLASGETVACAYRDFPDHFGFFLPLAGITTVRQIRDNAFDNLTQKAKEVALLGTEGEKSPNTAFVEGVRRFAMNVRELDIDLIDSINPFGEAYAILAKTMSEESLKQVAAVIGSKRANLTLEDARELAKRALKFKQERGLCNRGHG